MAPRTRRLSSSGPQRGRRLRFEVRNQGQPIQCSQLSRIFEPFERAAATDKPEAQRGSGLGLFIAREVVRMHGVQVHAQSGGGVTTFRVTLPRWA